MKDQLNLFYEFEKFCLEPAERRLLFEDEVVPLTPKAFDTLMVLVENRGKIIEKDFFLEKIWNDTYVEEATLAQNISTLRKALATFADGKTFIETIPRRGYRFVGDVREILGEEEIVVIERRHQTHIITEQSEHIDSSLVGSFRLRNFVREHVFASVSVLVVLVGAFFVWQLFLRPGPLVESRFQSFNVQNIESGAGIRQATISPDGKYVAFVEKSGDKQSLRLKQIDGGNIIEVAGFENSRIIGAAFSPDGSDLYFSAYDLEPGPTAKIGTLYKVPSLGGASQPILKDIDSPAAISPSGKKIAFIRNDPLQKETALMLADIDGTGEQKLSIRKFGAGFTASGPAWSPDEKYISCSARNETPGSSMELVVVDSQTGEQSSLTPQPWMWMGGSQWLNDGSGIAVVAYGSESPNLTDEIWLVSYPEGKARMITRGINGLSGLSLSADGKSIVAAKLNRITSFYVSSMDNLAEANEIATNVDSDSLLELGADFTPDSRIVYSQTQNGNADLWIMNNDGTARKQLTAEKSADFMPKVSADGRSIIFLTNRENSTKVWQTDIDGQNPKRISNKSNVFSPDLSGDGRWIYYVAEDENFRNNLWKESQDGGQPIKLTSGVAFAPKISPDGKLIACLYSESRDAPRLTIISAEDGKIVKQFDLPSENSPIFEWGQDNVSLYVVSDRSGSSSLWRLPIAGTKAEKLKDWQNRVFRFAISKDERQLFYEDGKQATSILHLQSQ